MEYNFDEYYRKSFTKQEIHYWDLPDTMIVGFIELPPNVLPKGKNISIRKLKQQVGNNKRAERKIKFLFVKRKNLRIKIKFPIKLNNIYYVRLYALMKSEGSFKSEFALHVPELFFHKVFYKSLQELLGNEIKYFIQTKKNKGILRTRANRIVRNLIPLNEYNRHYTVYLSYFILLYSKLITYH